MKQTVMKVTTIPIKGMHCRSCELLISDELMQVNGVQDVEISFQKGCAKVFHGKKTRRGALEQAILDAGYTVGRDAPKPWFSRNINDYVEVAAMAALLFIFYFIAKDTGLFRLIDAGSNNFASLPVVFLIGLTAGVSTCAALVGGLVLAVSSRFAEKNPDASTKEKFIPHLFFNLGRVVSFFIFGGVIGLIGSLFQMSLGFMGLLTIVIGGVMLVFGAELTELFPALSKFNITIPSGVAKFIGLKEQTGKEYSHRNAMVLGGLTFFLPCGFTQLVQLYAISTGNPLAGALTMGVFALGTTPGLLGIGGLTAIVKGSVTKPFFKFAGVLVIGLALFNISNGYNLSGLKARIKAPNSDAIAAGAQVFGDVQVLKSIYTSENDMQPNNFEVKAGQPVRLEIDVKDDGFGCMGSMALPGLSRQVEMLVKGQPMVFEFTPENPGSYDITCAMGVPRGTITVI